MPEVSREFGVLFVCTWNVCRSALADRLLHLRLEGERHGVRVSSAGTRARPGEPMEAGAVLVLNELGVDASHFASRRLTERLVTGADLVLGATRQHRDAAIELVPTAIHRAFTIKEFARLAACDDHRDPATLVAEAARRRMAVVDTDPSADDIAEPHLDEPPRDRRCVVELTRAVDQFAWLLRASAASRSVPFHQSPQRLDELSVGAAAT